MTERLDRVLVDERRELMADEFGMLLDVYDSESERLRVEIGAAWRAGDLERVRRAAHSLKGAAANLGALALAALCEQLERQARDQEPRRVADQLAQVDEELREVRAIVARLREQ